jgi:hypothetical protein
LRFLCCLLADQLILVPRPSSCLRIDSFAFSTQNFALRAKPCISITQGRSPPLDLSNSCALRSPFATLLTVPDFPFLQLSMQSKVLVSPPTKDLIQEGSLKMQHHAAPQTVIASMHSTAFTTTHQPPSSCSSWNKKKKHFATLSAGPLWWTGSLFLNAVQAEGWQSQMWHLLSSTPFFGSRKCHFTAELTLSAHRDDHTAALTAMIKEATVCAMVCQENVFALYCLLGQLGMDQPDTDLLVLLDKMRPISRLEDEMCSNEHLAESASGLEL